MSAENTPQHDDLFLPPKDFVPDPRPIILASSSPRRRKLLSQYGYRFEVIEPDPAAECGICSRETPPELVARLAFQKAADVLKNFTDEQLDEYLATDLWVGKAGSLGFQDGPPWLTLLKGSPTNVVGLPMELLSQQLKIF